MLVWRMSRYDVVDDLMSDENANWSRPAACALADWLTDLAAEHEEIENQPMLYWGRTDVRCAFNEYENAVDFIDQHGRCRYRSLDTLNCTADSDAEEIKDSLLDWIRERALLIEIPHSDGFIVGEEIGQYSLD